MAYAIVEIGGKQMWLQSGRFYDVNKLYASPGETLTLNKVLFVKKDDNTFLGKPCVKNYVVKAKVLMHLKGSKKLVFKMKRKKNKRSKKGYRQDLTRLFIQEI